jgi:hypothetical protein
MVCVRMDGWIVRVAVVWYRCRCGVRSACVLWGVLRDLIVRPLFTSMPALLTCVLTDVRTLGLWAHTISAQVGSYLNDKYTSRRCLELTIWLIDLFYMLARSLGTQEQDRRSLTYRDMEIPRLRLRKIRGYEDYDYDDDEGNIFPALNSGPSVTSLTSTSIHSLPFRISSLDPVS